MVKKEKEKIMLAEHVLEVRHAASGSFLDVRGYVADYVRESGILPHWKIDTNVVNFGDAPNEIEKEGAFAGFKSAGYMVYNPETRNYFVDKAGTFWRTLIKNQHYKLPEAIRFGTRTKVFLPSTKSFDEINKTIFDTFYTEQAKNIIGGKEQDVQFIFELIESQFNVRLSGGPIHENEVGKYLTFDSEEFKNCGIFLDLDYYKNKDIQNKDVPKLLKEAIELTWLKIENIANSLGL